MLIGSGAVITVRHYSLINVFKGMVLDARDNKVTVKLPKECLRTIFLEGDPLVVAYEADKEKVEITGAKVTDVNMEKEQLVFAEDERDEGMKQRSYERYPVSLYADFRHNGVHGNKKFYALVKDISEYGMLIYTKESLFKGLRLDLDVYLNRDILSLSAEIVRKFEYGSYFGYGLQIKHSGAVIFNHIKNVVKKAQQEHIILFSKE